MSEFPTTFGGTAGWDREIRFHQRMHIVALAAGVNAWLVSEQVAGPFTAVAVGTMLTEQSWSVDTERVSAGAKANGHRSTGAFDRPAHWVPFVPTPADRLLHRPPMHVLLLLPEGPEWVREDQVYFCEVAANESGSEETAVAV